MKIKELKEYLSNIPDEYDDWDVLMDVDYNTTGKADISWIFSTSPDADDTYICLVSPVAPCSD